MARRIARIENELVRVTVMQEGGHVAEILHKKSGINPLWDPPWPSIEPSEYSRERHPEYGSDAESQLLAGIKGHNLCLDLFGPPSPEEAAAGITVHGEASIAPYKISTSGVELLASATLPHSGLAFQRRIRLEGDRVLFTETVENLGAFDRPGAWTQHVTLGPPFLARGVTEFRVPATKSFALEGNRTFDWPIAPPPRGDLRIYPDLLRHGGFTTHLLDPHRDHAYFQAWSPESKVLFGYVWDRPDFPWLGIWEENHQRTQPPWNGKTMTRGMEFGASPIPETRRKMIGRHELFGVPAYRWFPARSRTTVNYSAFIRTAEGFEDRD